ncbi:MAG: YHS domain-containing (seleno)protein [Bacteroidota bacterium]
MKKAALIFLSFIALQTVVFSQSNKRQQAFNLSSKHVAIQGYDPVGYFAQGKAIEGKAAYSIMHDGVTYQFSSPQNKAAFLAQPTKYEPQYGGWCAYAMGATGEKVEVDPATFKIVDGKLFMFYNKFFNNTLKSWNKDEKSLHTSADANWTNHFKK